MHEIWTIVIYSLLSGITVIIGGLVAYFFRIRDRHLRTEILHWTIAFGGGVLLGAISFALVPRAMKLLDVPYLIILMVGGTFSFMAFDWALSKMKGSMAQLMGMMMDYLPESLALGASFAHDHSFGLLLAIFIGLQNLPEGFNTYGELRKIWSVKKTLSVMFALSFTGVVAALLGYGFLSNMPNTIAGIMLFAAGGILYLIFQDIAPLAKFRGAWLPASGASIGYLVGMLGEKLL